MKYIAILLLAVASNVAWSLEKGGTLPEFALITMDGKKTTSTANVGKTKLTYVDFWATWCPPCKQSFPFMNKLQETYGPKGLTITAISMDESPAEVKKFLKTTPAKFNVLYGDPDLIGEKAEPAGMPYSALIDANGKIIALHKGYNAKVEAKIEKEIADLLK